MTHEAKGGGRDMSEQGNFGERSGEMSEVPALLPGATSNRIEGFDAASAFGDTPKKTAKIISLPSASAEIGASPTDDIPSKTSGIPKETGTPPNGASNEGYTIGAAEAMRTWAKGVDETAFKEGDDFWGTSEAPREGSRTPREGREAPQETREMPQEAPSPTDGPSETKETLRELLDDLNNPTIRVTHQVRQPTGAPRILRAPELAVRSVVGQIATIKRDRDLYVCAKNFRPMPQEEKDVLAARRNKYDTQLKHNRRKNSTIAKVSTTVAAGGGVGDLNIFHSGDAKLVATGLIVVTALETGNWLWGNNLVKDPVKSGTHLKWSAALAGSSAISSSLIWGLPALGVGALSGPASVAVEFAAGAGYWTVANRIAKRREVGRLDKKLHDEELKAAVYTKQIGSTGSPGLAVVKKETADDQFAYWKARESRLEEAQYIPNLTPGEIYQVELGLKEVRRELKGIGAAVVKSTATVEAMKHGTVDPKTRFYRWRAGKKDLLPKPEEQESWKMPAVPTEPEDTRV